MRSLGPSPDSNQFTFNPLRFVKWTSCDRFGAQLRITKRGDAMLRRLLVSGAQYILGPFGPDTDLRRWGLRLAQRGGKNAKKCAVVAVARKLVTLLHRLWVSGATYQPLRAAAFPRRSPRASGATGAHQSADGSESGSAAPPAATAALTPKPSHGSCRPSGSRPHLQRPV